MHLPTCLRVRRNDMHEAGGGQLVDAVQQLPLVQACSDETCSVQTLPDPMEHR